MELRPEELAQECKSGRLRPAYYLLGEDASGKALALKELKASFKADEFNFREFSGEAGEVPGILSEAQTLPVFSERRLVLVSNPRIPPEGRQALAQYLKDPVKTTTLVLLSEDRKPDPKDPLAKAASACGALCLFGPLREEEAQERLKALARKAGKALSPEAAALLVAEAGTEWGTLSQELEKLMLFSTSREIKAEEALQSLGYQKAADPFALTRLIQERRLKESLQHLQRLLRSGRPEEAFRALGQIAAAVSRQLKAKLLLKAGSSPEEVFRALRLHQYWDRGYLKTLEGFPQERLVSDLKLCLATEADLKSKAWLDPKLELELLAAGLCRPRASD